MATNAFANVKGRVFKTDHREGFAKATGEAYAMDMVYVLVPDGGLTEVTLPETIGSEALARLNGTEVDYSVEIFRNKFGFGMKVLKENHKAAAVPGITPLHKAS